jgi:hypothetical protein
MWRPPNWKVPRFFKHALYTTPQLEVVYEGGANAMHRADVKWLLENLNDYLLSCIKDRVGQEEWEKFTEAVK